MPIGPTFTQANNDGQMDELLYMTGVLARRMNAIRGQRMEQLQVMQSKGLDVSEYSITPTISDIQMSHNLIVSSTYRPYIMTSFQYLKHNTGSGSAQYGSEIIFNMRTFGEFLSDSALLVELNQIQASSVDLRPIAADNSTFHDNLTSDDDSNTLTYTRYRYLDSNNKKLLSFSELGLAASKDGDLDPVSASNASAKLAAITAAYSQPIMVQNYVHYAEFPLHALIKSVRFQVNSNDIDNYTQETDNFYVHFLLPPGKLAAYYKCVGQELPQDGYTGLITNVSTDATNDVTDVLDVSPTIPDSISRGNQVSARKRVQVMTGFQTPAKQQPPLLGIYPNKFDHCKGIRKAIPVLAIPNTEREFTYNFATQERVVFTSPSNLFLEKIVDVMTLDDDAAPTTVVGNMLTLNNVTRIDTTRTLTPVTLDGSVLPTQTFKRAEEYLNNVFIDPAIHDLYLERIGFSLTRVHRTQAINVSTESGEHTLSSFKWPLEFFFAGLRPSSNGTDAPQRNWWRYSYNVEVEAVSPIYTTTWSKSSNVVFGAGAQIEHTFTGPGETVTYDLQYPTINKFKVSLQAIDLYEELDSIFFNSYLPAVYGNYYINSTPDKSALFITFTFAPASGQSCEGHINVSRSREFAVTYTSNIIGTNSAFTTSGVLHCVGECINFWLASSGNLHLRFS
jgi:hypothetical protein